MSRLWYWPVVLGALGLAGAASAPGRPLLGQALFRPVQTVEGPVPMPVGVEGAAFCRTYRCVGSQSQGTTTTGTLGWYVAPLSARAEQVLRDSGAGRFVPEATVMYEKNIVTFADLMFDTTVRAALPAATLNLLGHFTRLVLGAPISGQKLSACYRTLKAEARCTVGTGRIQLAGGATRTFHAAFRTVDDGAGYSRVNYAIELDD
ncbi:hypothetical protein [Deinococcus multiflagellatus]|uniref:Uncharacterized protein n=1 Tax=Deinococcus multiflagellatus TaxID=1656887 RepID=A0ABW1ZRE2_9DEIO|nr:hypothetical protein [Deinococcus multiflagellatus]MBZ9713611.1 hypothetical protein [Deinococcus multiflagellatus]